MRSQAPPPSCVAEMRDTRAAWTNTNGTGFCSRGPKRAHEDKRLSVVKIRLDWGEHTWYIVREGRDERKTSSYLFILTGFADEYYYALPTFVVCCDVTTGRRPVRI